MRFNVYSLIVYSPSFWICFVFKGWNRTWNKTRVNNIHFTVQKMVWWRCHVSHSLWRNNMYFCSWHPEWKCPLICDEDHAGVIHLCVTPIYLFVWVSYPFLSCLPITLLKWCCWPWCSVELIWGRMLLNFDLYLTLVFLFKSGWIDIKKYLP